MMTDDRRNPITKSPGEDSKGEMSFNFNYKVNYKDFYTKLCVRSQNGRYKYIYQTECLFCRLCHALGVGLGGGGGTYGSKIKFC